MIRKLLTTKFYLISIKNLNNFDDNYQNTLIRENNKEIKQADLPFQQEQKILFSWLEENIISLNKLRNPIYV